jgi:pimeloyl-ACP methyl ester carboxylesterase
VRWIKRTVDSDGVRLAVRDSGGGGKPVLLIHGLGFGQRSWDRVAPRLGTSSRVVTYDQRGHGASDASDDYSRAAFNTDLETVLDQLMLEDAVLVGHSLGAVVAVGHAASHPGCAGVVCVDGGVPVVLPRPDWELMEGEMRRPFARLAMWATKVMRLGSRLSFEEIRRVMEGYDAVISNLGGVYGGISCPVLLVVGSRPDPVSQGEEIRDAMREGVRRLEDAHPEVRVEWLPCGHNVPLQQPAELARLIVAFVS